MALLAGALTLFSCAKKELDISATFPLPTEVSLTTLVSSESSKDENGRRLFDLVLSDGTNNFAVTFVGSKYYLESNQYTEAQDAIAKKGNFILGKTKLNDVDVLQGTITVTQNESNYDIKAVVFLSDGSPYKLYWKGTLNYEPDAVLEPQYYYTDTVAKDCTLDDGQTLVETVESHTLQLKDLSGEFAAQIKLVRNVGTTDLAGTYTVKEYAHEDFSAGNGFDLGVFFGMDPGAYVIGSYYLDEGAVVIIQPGETINVTDMGDGVYSIEGSTGYSFLAAPEGYVPGGGTVYDMEETIAKDCTLEDGQTLVEDVESHTLVLKDGEDVVAQIKLIRSAGATDLEGSYTVKEYAHEDYTAGNGFDLGVFFGMDPGAYVIGSYYYNEEGELVIIEPGATITVTKIADGTYKFEGEDYEFTGKIKADNPDPNPDPNPNPNPDPQPGDEVTLKEFLSLTDYSGYSMNMVGIELGTAGFYYQAPDWQTTFTASYPVDGQFIKLELYAEGGVVAPGTYVPSAVNGTVAAGEFNLGADNGWGGFNGTSWFTVASGAATGVAVTDGTVTVSEAGGVYTIEINTTAVKAKYVGKLSNEPDPTIELKEFLSLTDYSGYSMNMVGIELGTEGFSYQAPDWQTTFTASYPVDGQFIKLELYAEGGVVAPGTYVPSAANGTVAAGEFNLGADNGWGGFNGTSWFTVASGAATGVAVTDGTVTVSNEGDVYTIEIETTAVKAKYVGKLSK